MKNKKRPVYLYLTGGLGNQLFMYSAAYAYSKKYNRELYIDKDSYSWYQWKENEVGFALDKIVNKLNIRPKSKLIFFFSFGGHRNIISRIFRKFFWMKGKVFIEKKTFVFEPELLNNGTYDGLYGYFQSPKYFETYKNELISLFKLPICTKDSQVYEKRISQVNNSVAIHYRDYKSLGSVAVSNRMGEPSLEYYRQAISTIEDETKNSTYFVFSDNINKAKEKLSDIKNLIFVDYKSENVWDDMALMSICNHNIISNSSYSWWSAYLNTNSNKKIIAPKTWGNIFNNKIKNDLFPEEWILI